MRSDMAQVLIERPRRGSRIRGYRRQRCVNRRARLDDSAKSEAIHRREGGRDKYFNDLFGPLIRFLDRNVNRPWDNVYADICRQNDLRSVAQKHLRHHIFDFVETSVLLINGAPYTSDGRYPLGRFGRTFYVCPKTGLLRRVKRPRAKPTIGGRITISKCLQYHRLEGIWCEVVLRPIPEDREGCWDAVLDKRVSRVTRDEATRAYGFEAYALSKRPLDRKETARLLKNTKRKVGRTRKNRST